MTLAICHKCGAEKFGAVNHCPVCGYYPMHGSDRDIARAMLFSDHYMSRESLLAMGRDIAAGVHVNVDDEVVETFAQQISMQLNKFRNPPEPPKKWWQFWR